MKKNVLPDHDEMPAEFDLSNSIPNPWFVAVHGPEYVRVIDKDLAALFPDNEAMNAALRSIPRKTRTAAPTAKKKKTCE